MTNPFKPPPNEAPGAAQPNSAAAGTENFDTSTHENFYEYYKNASLSPATLQRFEAIADAVMRMRSPSSKERALDVLDIGCGAGTQSRFWADKGHCYLGVDINEPLIQLARERAQAEGRVARFEVSSATLLPFADASFDICLIPELLEHISDWEICLNEASRVLRPGGMMYISTTNWLCPKQQEYNLFAYSWYPGFAKRYVEKRAFSDWPEVANFAKYPAVHWFSFYQLSRFLAARGFKSYDRFDIMRLDNKSSAQRAVVSVLRAVAPLRFAGHVLTAATTLVAKRGDI